jgi:hypothetical protein
MNINLCAACNHDFRSHLRENSPVACLVDGCACPCMQHYEARLSTVVELCQMIACGWDALASQSIESISRGSRHAGRAAEMHVTLPNGLDLTIRNTNRMDTIGWILNVVRFKGERLGSDEAVERAMLLLASAFEYAKGMKR